MRPRHGSLEDGARPSDYMNECSCYGQCMGHGIHGHTRSGKIDAHTARDVAETMHALATASRVLILGRLRSSA